MDVDAFAAVHRQEWDRLASLAGRRPRSAAEVDELVTLYQRTATHLSMVRSSGGDPVLTSRLSRLVSQGRSAVSGGHEPVWREVTRLAVVSIPAALWRSRWWTAASAAFSLVIALATGIWVARTPAVQASLAGDEEISALVDHDFSSYYTEHPAAYFAFHVWTNNAWLAAQCVLLGITGVMVGYVLLTNALNLGAVGGLMAAHHRLDLFFGLITPHGLLELTAVFAAAGAGLQLFWAWIDPGPMPRSQALAREGRSMVTVAIGLFVVLGVSGVVEAFVTPSPLPTWARIGIGVVVWLAFLAYVAVLGRRAAAAGETGDLRRELIEDTAPVVG
jgi:uncharacterized membrane protein SpoIIM required for sporulation